MTYTVQQPFTFRQRDYVAGDVIPAGELPPGYTKARLRQGVIVETPKS